MPVAAPSDKRFRRSHVRPARRRRPWTGRGWQFARASAALALALYGIYRGALLVVSAEALRVTRITVSGNVRLAKGEVIALMDGLRGQSMVTVDIDRWRQKLMTSPWVGGAVMRRVLPGTIAVTISERQPMGIGRLGGDLYLIDQHGTIIDEYGPNYAELDLPIIDGLAGPPRDGSPLIDEGRAALAARLLASLQAQPQLAERVSQVDVSDVRDASIILEDDPVLLRVGDDQFVERLQAYLDLAPALRERVDAIDYVDLRFEERIYVRSHLQQGRGARAEGRSARSEGRGARGATPAAKGEGRGARSRRGAANDTRRKRQGSRGRGE